MYGHGRRTAEDLGQSALMLGIQMLHEHEAHAGVGGNVIEQFGERFQPARRCTHADDGKLFGVRSGLCTTSSIRDQWLHRVTDCTKTLV